MPTIGPNAVVMVLLRIERTRSKVGGHMGELSEVSLHITSLLDQITRLTLCLAVSCQGPLYQTAALWSFHQCTKWCLLLQAPLNRKESLFLDTETISRSRHRLTTTRTRGDSFCRNRNPAQPTYLSRTIYIAQLDNLYRSILFVPSQSNRHTVDDSREDYAPN